MQRYALVWAAAVLLSACGASIQSARFVTRDPRPPDQEVLIYSSKVPECAYEEIGVVTGSPRTRLDSMQEVLDAMRSRARNMGGDAIVGLGVGRQVTGGSVAGDAVSVDSKAALAGTVVRFTDQDCRR